MYIPVMIKEKCGLIKAIKVGKTWNGLRASVDDEVNGLDISEHDLESAYADFLPTAPSYDGETTGVDVSSAKSRSSPVKTNSLRSKTLWRR